MKTLKELEAELEVKRALEKTDEWCLQLVAERESIEARIDEHKKWHVEEMHELLKRLERDNGNSQTYDAYCQDMREIRELLAKIEDGTLVRKEDSR